MSSQYTNEPLLDIFIFETTQLVEQLEQIIINSEKSCCFNQTDINEIFRIMHTIKGSAAMMFFNNISTLAHSIEDLFYYLREEKPQGLDYSALGDLILEGVDFVKTEISKLEQGYTPDADASALIAANKDFLTKLKELNFVPLIEEPTKQPLPDTYHCDTSPNIEFPQSEMNMFKAVIYFEEESGMENIRAFSIIHNLETIATEIYHNPQNIFDSDVSQAIRVEGFTVFLKANYSYEDIHQFFTQTALLKEIKLEQLATEEEFRELKGETKIEANSEVDKNRPVDEPAAAIRVNEGKEEKELQQISPLQQSIISVNVSKLDKLMDLMGELVIAEAMVTQNPDLKGLELSNFHMAARQLHKITSELQDVVMSVRMVALTATFQKMHRVVRDMSKKLGKEVKLKIIGEETEVDKNIIEHISDPLMHLVRNAIDHGLESKEERQEAGKPAVGTITLEAKNAGSDVLIIVRDDGKGLNRERILEKARKNKLLYKNEAEMTDREIFNLILLPGFSTKDSVTEFSGRGVGLDVVCKNIESVGGSVSLDSMEGSGTTFTMKIPLTLAIIDGMNISVGNSRYTIPTINIRESFRPKPTDIITEPNGNEIVMVRGQYYPIYRLHELLGVKTDITDFADGILIIVEQNNKSICLFADELLGQQQIVVKPLPNYIRNENKINGLAGCTLLGDGSISLILDIGSIAGY